MKRSILFLVMLTFFTASPALASLNFIGEFSNVRYTEEYAYGSAVQLWREGDKLYGLFYYNAGLQGDTPRGRLENLIYDPSSGRVTFTARFSAGVIMDKGKQAPSQDVFIFEGVLQKEVLAGRMVHGNALDTKAPPVSEDVKLVKIKFDERLIENVTSINSFMKYSGDVLKFHGPKR